MICFPLILRSCLSSISNLLQIWKNPQLWAGFLKCVVQTKPQSFSVLLQVGFICLILELYFSLFFTLIESYLDFYQLPAAQLENALNRNHILKEPVREHANQPSIRSTLPRFA